MIRIFYIFVIIGAIAALAVVLGRFLSRNETMIHHSHPPIERIQILLPFVFSPAIDPRDVFTVGDQVVLTRGLCVSRAQFI